MMMTENKIYNSFLERIKSSVNSNQIDKDYGLDLINETLDKIANGLNALDVLKQSNLELDMALNNYFANESVKERLAKFQ